MSHRRLHIVRTWCTALALLLTAATVFAQISLQVDGAIESRSGGFGFPDGTVQTTAVGPFVAAVPDTGQRECFDVVGDPISCVGTGQDGETQAGVNAPTPRFTLNGDGTATDNLTGLIWLREADCFGERTFGQALDDAASLQAGFCGLLDGSLPGDWRLPNVLELLSLVDFGESQPVLSKGHPFENVQSSSPLDSFYWTSTTNQTTPDAAFSLSMLDGVIAFSFKDGSLRGWFVREQE